MARGQETNITGGQIDPYVQQSMQQNKSLAENRLVAAMQETAQTQRSRESNATQANIASAQMENQREMQAAQTQADDRRAAEIERGRREDRLFQKTMVESTQLFQAEQAKLEREYQDASKADDRAYLEKLDERREALRRFEIEKSVAANERNTNAILTMIRGSMQKESSSEKATTVLMNEAEQFDKDKDIHERTINRVIENVNLDKRMDTPTKIGMEAKTRTTGPTRGIGGLSIPSYETYKTPSGSMEVLQSQLDKFNTNMTVENINPESIHNLESEITNGKITPKKVRDSLSVLHGMAKVLDDKFTKASNDVDAKVWKDSYRQVIRMRDAIEGLQYSDKKIQGDDTRTVGGIIKDAIGPIYQSSLGGTAARYRDLAGGNFSGVLDEMTKAMQVPSLWPVSDEMNKFDKEIREKENAMLLRLYPNLGGVE